MADAVLDAYGNYSRFSPGQRRLLAEYTPFLARTMPSSARFLGVVLPRDHPTLALLTANQRATADWRDAMGLDDLPSWLAGGLSTR